MTAYQQVILFGTTGIVLLLVVLLLATLYRR